MSYHGYRMANLIDLAELTGSLQTFQVEIKPDELVENWGEWSPQPDEAPAGQPASDEKS